MFTVISSDVYTFYRHPVDNVDKAKYLKIVVDNQLTFGSHIIISGLNFLVRKKPIQLKTIIPTKTLMHLYYTMFHSQLLYGLPLCGAICSSYIHRIRILQTKPSEK